MRQGGLETPKYTDTGCRYQRWSIKADCRGFQIFGPLDQPSRQLARRLSVSSANPFVLDYWWPSLGRELPVSSEYLGLYDDIAYETDRFFKVLALAGPYMRSDHIVKARMCKRKGRARSGV